MDKVWLQQYPQGIPAEVEYRAYRSLKEILEASCTRFADRPAYGNLGVTITYRELDQLSRDFAAYLQKVAGLKKGERLAIMLPNLLQYPIALFGAQRAGIVVVNTNPLYTARELEHQLKDSGAVGDRRAGKLRAHAGAGDAAHRRQDRHHDPDRRSVPRVQADADQSRRQACEEAWCRSGTWQRPSPSPTRWPPAAPSTLDDVADRPDDLAFLQYTGGTTGVAKGAMLTQANMVANLQQVAAWIARDLNDGKEVAIIPLPLYHVYALTATWCS